MKSTLALLAIEAAFARASAQSVVRVPFEKRYPSQPASRLHARQEVVTEPLTNGQILYLANVSVGTPPQKLSLQIDTGSSDVWMSANSAPFCLQSSDNCAGGTFNPNASSTFQEVDDELFEISYVDKTSANGIYFTDQLSVGDATIKSQQMGLATDTDIGLGIMGVGYTADESVCAQSDSLTCQTYPSIIDQMKSQNKIKRKAYSLWLDDLESTTGNVLFGGIDSAKYEGPLVGLPIQVDSDSQAYTSFTVAWTNLTLNTPNGQVGGLWPNNYAAPAILDSGTTLMLMPDNVAAAVYAQFGATYYSDDVGYIAACSLSKSTALFDFQFGGPNGPRISVPTSEFLIPLTYQSGKPFTVGKVPYCQLGIQAANGNPILLGDTFLRSAYVVYDLDNNEIAIAQSNFNPSGSNVHEIPASGAIPGVSSTAQGASVTQSATSRGFFGLTSAGRGGASSAGGISSATGTPLAMYTASNQNAPANINAGVTAATSQGAANLVSPPSGRFEVVLMGALTALAAISGSSMLFL